MATTPAHIKCARELAIHADRKQIQELTDIIIGRSPLFYVRALRQLGNAADAEDAIQDAFLSAYSHLNQFKGQAQMSTWLTTIVINAVKMKARQRPRQLHIPLDQQDQEPGHHSLAERLSDHRPGPEEAYRAWELAELLGRLSARLSPASRRTLKLREIDGLSTREAAQVLGLPEGTVKARAARARAHLKRLVQSSFGGKRAAISALL